MENPRRWVNWSREWNQTVSSQPTAALVKGLFTKPQSPSIRHQPHRDSKAKISSMSFLQSFFCQQLLQKAISESSSQFGKLYTSSIFRLIFPLKSTKTTHDLANRLACMQAQHEALTMASITWKHERKKKSILEKQLAPTHANTNLERSYKREISFQIINLNYVTNVNAAFWLFFWIFSAYDADLHEKIFISFTNYKLFKMEVFGKPKNTIGKQILT